MPPCASSNSPGLSVTARKGSPGVSEELGLEQLVRKRGTVHVTEPAFTPRTALVDRPRRQLLPHPTRTSTFRLNVSPTWVNLDVWLVNLWTRIVTRLPSPVVRLVASLLASGGGKSDRKGLRDG